MLHPDRPLRTLDDVARLLRQSPVRQQLTTLSRLRLIPELLITWDDQDFIAAPSALGDLLRVQGRLPGLSKRSLRLSLALAVAETLGGQPVPNRPGAIHFPAVGETCSYRQVLAMLDEGLVEAELPDWYLTEIAAINWHLMEADRPVLVRWTGATIIAICSPSFTPVDHIDVVEALRRKGLWRLAWVSLTRRSLNLAVYLDQPAMVLGDDVYHTGVQISNSETGDGRLVVNGYLYRKSHRDGAIISERHRRRFGAHIHLGDRSALMASLDQDIERALASLTHVRRGLEQISHQVLSPRRWANVVREVRLVAGPTAVARLSQRGFEGAGVPAYAAFTTLLELASHYSGGRRQGLEYLSGSLLQRMAR